ncbi:MAG: phage Gp37/Gp68 family protein [Fusobacteriaceae bacterium]|jgi:protein gp37|nr:phage Gp37/Gp68 family protein [Fusobacteriaceae bacterium]
MSLWNPWHGCNKISAGCENCYVYRGDARYERDASKVTKTKNFDLPIKKNKKGQYKIIGPEVVYTCFTSDFFLDKADEWRISAWEYMRERKDLDFFFITKRIDRFYVNLPKDWGEGYDNVTICCTVENQKMADYRLPIYLSLPIKHKQIICEPLLEHIDFRDYLSGRNINNILCGGESGNEARICDYEWVLNIRRQAILNGVSFYFKQTGAKFIKDGKLYNIPRKYQGFQAAKANISYYFE